MKMISTFCVIVVIMLCPREPRQVDKFGWRISSPYWNNIKFVVLVPAMQLSRVNLENCHCFSTQRNVCR